MKGSYQLLQLYLAGSVMGGIFQMFSKKKKHKYSNHIYYVNLGASASVYSMVIYQTLLYPNAIYHFFFFPVPAYILAFTLISTTIFQNFVT